MRRLFYNGTIITMSDELYVEALCIENDTIIGVGKENKLRMLLDEGDECIDLKGNILLPGFIDAHSHFTGVANSLSQCDLSQAHCFEDIKNMMIAFIKEHHIQEGEWVYGSHYDHNDLVERSHPDKSLLDEISLVHPIVIVHTSSHMGVANSLALKSQHISSSTLDPIGGKYGREKGSLEPNGYMEEKAFIQFQNQAPMVSVERMMELFQEAQHIYASYGITTIQEGMVAQPLFDLLHYAAKKNLFQQDIIGFVDIANCSDLIDAYPQYKNQYHHHFKLGGYKTFLDGSPQGKTAWMTTPYQGSDNECGYPVLSNQQLYNQILTALQQHQQLLAHCNGDAAAEQYITQFKKVLDDYSNLEACRPVMIHAQLVRHDQLQRMKAINMIPSFFVAHTYYWGDVHIQNFTQARANFISPTKDAMQLQMPFTLHQDAPVLMPDMLKTVWCAVNRVTKQGIVLGEQERIPPYEALKAITVYPAYQYFEESQKGTLEVGKKADLVILDKNPLLVPPLTIDTIQVLQTIKDGNVIYQKNSQSNPYIKEGTI